MASGNLSPRQKMINLMYLIFIAMLAMNMSKEVLQAFGLMDTKLVSANEAATARNARSYEDLALKAVEQAGGTARVVEHADHFFNRGLAKVGEIAVALMRGLAD